MRNVTFFADGGAHDIRWMWVCADRDPLYVGRDLEPVQGPAHMTEKNPRTFRSGISAVHADGGT